MTDFFFSKTLDDTIYPLEDIVIKKVFANNTCFLERLKKDVKRLGDYSAKDNITGFFKFVEAYDQCKENYR